jgi:hypothetical protein
MDFNRFETVKVIDDNWFYVWLAPLLLAFLLNENEELLLLIASFLGWGDNHPF